MHAPSNKGQKAAASGVVEVGDPNAAQFEDDALFRQFEDMTAAAAKAAKDYRFWMLEHMKINMTAALNCANGVAGVNSRIASAAHPDASEQGKNTHPQSIETTAPTVTSVADAYRVKAFELMTVNINATLEYAQRLAHAKTSAEFIELSTTHAHKRFELIMKQTTELGSIAQRLATPDIASMTASFAKLLSERK